MSWEIDWYVCRGENKEELWRVARSIGPIMADHNHWAGWFVADDEKNARLVSAAPEMYEALQVVLHSLISLWQSEFETSRNAHPEDNDPAVQLARKVIAKVEGRDA